MSATKTWVLKGDWKSEQENPIVLSNKSHRTIVGEDVIIRHTKFPTGKDGRLKILKEVYSDNR